MSLLRASPEPTWSPAQSWWLSPEPQSWLSRRRNFGGLSLSVSHRAPHYCSVDSWVELLQCSSSQEFGTGCWRAWVRSQQDAHPMWHRQASLLSTSQFRFLPSEWTPLLRAALPGVWSVALTPEAWSGYVGQCSDAPTIVFLCMLNRSLRKQKLQQP